MTATHPHPAPTLLASTLVVQYMSGPSKIASVPDEDELERARLGAQARKAAATAAMRSLASAALRNNPAARPQPSPAADDGTGARALPTVPDESAGGAAAAPAGLTAAVAQVIVHVEQETIPFEQIVLVWRDLRCGVTYWRVILWIRGDTNWQVFIVRSHDMFTLSPASAQRYMAFTHHPHLWFHTVTVQVLCSQPLVRREGRARRRPQGP